MPSFGRRGAPVDWLIVGLGNPGSQYQGTPHNIGFEVAERLIERWALSKPKSRYRGLITEGAVRITPAPITSVPTAQATDTSAAAITAESREHRSGPRDRLQVAILMPQTYMNEAGRSVGPARGELQVEPDHIIVVHDEIDLPFAEIRTRLGGGLAGHNGLKSIKAALGTADFHRVRVGVGRPPTTDPEQVAAYVLGKFREPRDGVENLIDCAANEVSRMLS